MKLVTKKTKREELIEKLDKLLDGVPREEIDYIELTEDELIILIGGFAEYSAVADFTYSQVPLKVKK